MTRYSTGEKLEMWQEQHKLRKTDYEEAEYKFIEDTPWGYATEGAPSMRKVELIMFPAVGAAAWWVYNMLLVIKYGWVMDPVTANIGVLALFVICSLGFSSLYRLNESTTSDHRFILEPLIIWTLKGIFRSRMRVKRATQVYPFSQDILSVLDTIPELEEVAKKEAAEAAKKKAEEEAKKKAEEEAKRKGAPEPTGGLPGRSPERRPSSVEEMTALFKDVLGHEPKQYESESEVSAKLMLEFAEKIRDTKMLLYGTFLETPTYDCLVVSERPLVGTKVDMLTGVEYVELQLHSYVQKTYAFQKKHQNATWAVFMHLTDHRYYVNVGKKYKLRYAPVFYVAASDGLLSNLAVDLHSALVRSIPTLSEIQAAKDAHDATLAEILMAKTINQAGIIEAKDKELEIEKRKNLKQAKKFIAEGFRVLLHAKESLEIGTMATLISLFGGGTVKTLAKLIIVVLAIFAIIVIVQMITGIVFIPGTGDGGSGGTTATQPGG